MGYFIRVLGTDVSNIAIDQLRAITAPAVIDVELDAGDAWRQVVLKHSSGPEIPVIERNQVIENELGAEELEEFIEEVQSHKPEAAAMWLRDYLPDYQDHICVPVVEWN